MVRSTTVAIFIGMLSVLTPVFAQSNLSFPQSKLPPCQNTQTHLFDNCSGASGWYDGRQYTGEWKNGQKHGLGALEFENGDIFFGEWKNDQRNGRGTYEWSDGTIYIGEYKNDKRHGDGTELFDDGAVYAGSYIDGAQSGTGTFTYGINSFDNGAKYVGEFRDNRYHGRGTLYASDGSVLKKGLWEDDELGPVDISWHP